MLLKNLRLISYDYIDMMFKYFKLTKKGKRMKNLLAMLVLAVFITGCVFVAKEADKECAKAEEKCESVSDNDVNS